MVHMHPNRLRDVSKSSSYTFARMIHVRCYSRTTFSHMEQLLVKPLELFYCFRNSKVVHLSFPGLACGARTLPQMRRFCWAMFWP